MKKFLRVILVIVPLISVLYYYIFKCIDELFLISSQYSINLIFYSCIIWMIVLFIAVSYFICWLFDLGASDSKKEGGNE